MSLIIDNDGTITLYQGDSGELVVSGLDKAKNYTVYFAIQDINRNLIGEELQVAVTNSDTVTFILTPEYTNLLVENTMFIAESTYGDLNRIIVYPQKVKGV